MKRIASYLAPPLLCLAVFWRVPLWWFRDDDFAWLTLVDQPLADALFRPAAQGTVRILSERVYWLALTEAFGFAAWPFRAVAFGTWFLVLALIQWIGTRLTGSRSAGLWAALLWTVSLTLATPLGWAAAYNQICTAFLVTSAFAARLKWLETNSSKWRWIEAGAYLLGFASLETMVMYPAIVLLHAAAFPEARPRWKRSLWMLAPAAAFAALQLFVIPKSDSPIYQRIVDARLPATLWTYIEWAVGPSQMAVRNAARQTQGLIVTWIIAAALASFAAWRVKDRDLRGLFFWAWFLVWIGPMLLLPNHISDYYLTIPGIGLAWLAGWALAQAWRSGIVLRVSAVALAGAYMTGSIAEVDAVTKWFLNLTSRGRVAVRGVDATHASFPAKAILLTGIDDEVFLHSLAGGADRVTGAERVWLLPGRDAVLDSGRVPGMERFKTTPEALQKALEDDEVRVLDVEGPVARDITARYRAARLATAAPR